MQEQLIELYCCTGRSQAEKLITEVIRNTSLPFRKEALNSFSCWTWDYNDVDKKLWKYALPSLKRKITELFLEKVIISGRWGY